MRRSALIALAIAGIVAFAVPSVADAKGAQLMTSTAARAGHLSRLACFGPALICAGKEAIDAVGGAAGGVVGAGASAAASATMGGVVSWAAEGAAWLVTEIAQQIERSTRPEVTDPWFARRYDGMVVLTAPLAAIFLLLATIQAIVRQDFGRLARAVFLNLPCALLLTFSAVTLTQLALRATDEMTSWVLSGSGDKMKTAFKTLAEVFAGTSPSPLAPFVLFLGSVFTSLFALLVWLELVMREAAIYVALAFLPLTLAAMIWERTAHWARRLAEWLSAIILAKFTIAVAFVLAASAITEGTDGAAGLSAVLGGCAVLLFAGLTPWALLKLIPFAESAAGRSLSPSHVKGAAMSVPGAMTSTIAARQLAFRNFGGMGASRSSSGSHVAVPATPITAAPTSSDSSAGAQAPTDLPRVPDRRPARPNKERMR